MTEAGLFFVAEDSRLIFRRGEVNPLTLARAGGKDLKNGPLRPGRASFRGNALPINKLSAGQNVIYNIISEFYGSLLFGV